MLEYWAIFLRAEKIVIFQLEHPVLEMIADEIRIDNYDKDSLRLYEEHIYTFFRGEGPLLLAQEVSHSLTQSVSQ